jgi:sugar-specific transcriptional regulator TrmB
MRVAWAEFGLLDEAGFGSYEKRALVTLAVHGVSDAATLCREGDIPTSKIYAAMEKLARLGLIEVRRSRPQLYAALPPEPLVERLNALARERADAFATASAGLRAAFEKLPRKLKGSQARVDLALGADSHIKRHVSRLTGARRRVLSYLESGDIAAMRMLRDQGFDVLKAIARERERSCVEHRVIFGFSDRSAPRLLEFLREFAASTRTLSGVRYSGEMGHPFHVVDDDIVILALDHPFVGEGRFASLLVQDAGLAAQLTEGFEQLWQRALKNLREIRAWPGRSGRA